MLEAWRSRFVPESPSTNPENDQKICLKRLFLNKFIEPLENVLQFAAELILREG